MSDPLETVWDFAGVDPDPGSDLAAVGGDLAPGTLVSAYLNGFFPMGLGDGGHGELGWWSPQQRGVLRRGDLRISKSLKKSARRYRVTSDRCFSDVIHACADPQRDGAWITSDVIRAYEQLHRLGIAHSVEVWFAGELAGGLYGLSLGGLFAGESMFHRRTDASKVALIALSQLVFADDSPRLIDVQWLTPHLASLGAIEVPRDRYRGALEDLVSAPNISGWGEPLAIDAVQASGR